MRYYLCLFFFYIQTLTAMTMEDCVHQNRPLKVGIITALLAERGNLLDCMKNVICKEDGKRTYYHGLLFGIDTVLTASRIGKVASAATAAHLILQEKVDIVLFIGVAGAIDPDLNVGDIIIGQYLIQHDMDASPFCPPYTIPLLNLTQIASDPLLSHLAYVAAETFLESRKGHVSDSALQEFAIDHPKTLPGLILTGDQVISDTNRRKRLKEKLPDALCVEMEGASIAQVCYEYEIPFTVIRTISDYADHNHVSTDIRKFVGTVAEIYSVQIIEELYRQIHQLTP